MNYLLRKVKRELLFLLGAVVGTRQYARVVIVTRSRSGSNMLCSFLESHPDAFVWREVFRRPHYFTPNLTDRIIHWPYLDKYKAMVFKVFYYHRVPADFWDRLVADLDTRIIHLIRENHLDTYVSQRQAASSKKWESFTTFAHVNATSPKIRVDTHDLLKFIEQNDRQVATFANRISGREKTLTLTFEQLATGDGRAAVADFLAPVLNSEVYGETRNLKQNPESAADRMTNFEEVRRALSTTRWKHFVDP